MSRKNINYNKMFEEPETVEHFDDIVEEVAELVESEPELEPVTGTVACERLNVRQKPNKQALILCVVTKGAELILDEEGATEDFYKVYTATGIEGFCMKQFITVK